MYACPNCGGNLKFDIPSQQLACEYCHTQADPYSYDDKDRELFEQKEYEATVFTCPQCGGEILSTDTSAAEFCSFCGASTILHSHLANEKRPNYIIPFQKTKEDCKKAYSKMMRRAIFAPDALKDPKYIDGFRGIYMPYWAFHLTQQDNFSLKAQKTHRRGDYIITDHYTLKGEIDAYYKGLSYDASSSFDDHISEAIAPYDVKGVKSFTPAYLSGFYADTADVASSSYEKAAHDIAQNNSIKTIRSTREFAGLEITTNLNNGSNVLNTQTVQVDNAMFPVWFMSYRNGDRITYATVNGQTGKVVADLPIDTKKYVLGSLLLALPIFLLLNLFFTVIPSVLLFITTIIAVITLLISGFEIFQITQKESPGKKEPMKRAGLTASIVAIIIGGLILLLQPASDLFYYSGSILSLLAIFFSVKDIIFNYNILSSRKLPQFNRTGGDDRA